MKPMSVVFSRALQGFTKAGVRFVGLNRTRMPVDAGTRASVHFHQNLTGILDQVSGVTTFHHGYSWGQSFPSHCQVSIPQIGRSEGQPESGRGLNAVLSKHGSINHRTGFATGRETHFEHQGEARLRMSGVFRTTTAAHVPFSHGIRALCTASRARRSLGPSRPGPVQPLDQSARMPWSAVRINTGCLSLA